MPSPLVRSGPTRILKTYLPPPLSYSSAPVQRWSGFRGAIAQSTARSIARKREAGFESP